MPELLDRLNRANEHLARVLGLLTEAPAAGVPLTPEHLSNMLIELLSIGERLQRRHAEHDPELANAIRVYRQHLERLRACLPCLHAQLLTERARLEAERSHLEAASAWAGSSRRTR